MSDNETVIEADEITETLAPKSPEEGPAQQSLIQRAELVPVGQTGAQPQNLAQQINYAQYMARAVSALPEHLRNNVGDCLAVIDIASRAGLSPYMTANKTYIQNGRLCFESQLFHALLVQSNLIIGDLTVEYEGEGDERVCIVTGILRSDKKPRVHRSPKLKDVHPGYTTKIVGNVEKRYVKGSPLWDKKPDVQLFYDTSRDWTRLYAPTATLGILTPEEVIETPLGEEGAIAVPNTSSDLHSRLKGVDRTEGHQPGFAEKELANVAGGTKEIKASPQQIPRHKPRSERRAARLAKQTTKKAQDSQPKQDAAEQEKPMEQAQANPIEPKQEQVAEAKPKKTITTPTNSDEYEIYATAWIDKTEDADMIEARWDDEYDMRNDCQVRVSVRAALQEKLLNRCQELRKDQ